LAANDSQWVEIACWILWEIRGLEEELRALRVANETSHTTKIVKIHALQSQHSVWAGAGRFVQLMRKSEPLPYKRIELRREGGAEGAEPRVSSAPPRQLRSPE
jgi:hypothetical protein